MKAVGVDWKEIHGPFSVNAAAGYNDEVILTGNYLRNVHIGDTDLQRFAPQFLLN